MDQKEKEEKRFKNESYNSQRITGIDFGKFEW